MFVGVLDMPLPYLVNSTVDYSDWTTGAFSSALMSSLSQVLYQLVFLF